MRLFDEVLSLAIPMLQNAFFVVALITIEFWRCG